MTARRFTFIVILTSIMLPAALAHAALPSAANSTCPGFIRIVGGTPSGPDVTDGLFTVVVRDAVGTGSPIGGSRVTVSFCLAEDLRICQDQQNPAYTVDCEGGTVSALSDLQGVAQFTIIGGSYDLLLQGASSRGSVKIYADDPVTHQNVLISDESATTGLVCSAPDLSGTGGLGASDFSLFANDLGSSWQRSDFNGDGVVDVDDESILLGIFGSGRMMISCPSYCLSCATPTRSTTWGSLKLHYGAPR